MSSQPLQIPALQVNGIEVVSATENLKKAKSKLGAKIESGTPKCCGRLRFCQCNERRLAGTITLLDALYKTGRKQCKEMKAFAAQVSSQSPPEDEVNEDEIEAPQATTAPNLKGLAKWKAEATRRWVMGAHDMEPSNTSGEDSKASGISRSESTSSLTIETSSSQPNAATSQSKAGTCPSTTLQSVKSLGDQIKSAADMMGVSLANSISQAPVVSSSKALDHSDAESVWSVSSTISIEYDFDRPREKISYSGPSSRLHAIEYAPHTYFGEDGLLDPRMAIYMARQPESPKKVDRDTKFRHPLECFYGELRDPPKEALDEVTGGLRRAWLYESRPELFNRKGELQEYVIHKRRPDGMSRTFWLWLCGRDKDLPNCGPPAEALGIIMMMILAEKKEGTKGVFGNDVARTALVRISQLLDCVVSTNTSQIRKMTVKLAINPYGKSAKEIFGRTLISDDLPDLADVPIANWGREPDGTIKQSYLSLHAKVSKKLSDQPADLVGPIARAILGPGRQNANDLLQNKSAFRSRVRQIAVPMIIQKTSAAVGVLLGDEESCG